MMIKVIENERLWSMWMIAILILGAGWTFLSRFPSATAASEASSAPAVGFHAPDFTLEMLGGGQVTLSDLRGKVVVINFWASWCPPCRAEMPAIEKSFQQYKDQGVVILGVNTTYQDSEQDAVAFVREHGLTFPIPLDQDGSVSKRYAINGLPTTFFIDRSGIIRAVVVGGPMSTATVQSNIEDLLQGNP